MSAIEINDELSFTTVPEINQRGRVFIKQDANPVFNLSRVSFCDNAGVALLISWARYAKSNNKKISFIDLPKQLSDLIEANGLKEILLN